MSNGFYAINPIAGQKSSSPACAAGVVNTMIGLTISTDGTVVFWGMCFALQPILKWQRMKHRNCDLVLT